MTLSLQKIQNLLRQEFEYLFDTYHVSRIGIFGSYARQSANPDSDIDLLIEFSEPIGWEIIDLYDFLERLLGRKVDLVTPRALKPQIKDSILQQVVYL